jgi:secondary thiamine-phosphate synthase enzyme
MVHTHTEQISTSGQGDAQDVTAMAARAVDASGARAGLATVFVVGSTAGVSTIELESGVVEDIDRALETVAPRGGEYRHHLRWHDDNGSSHVRAAIVGPSVTVPFREGRLMLGTWQQIVVLEFDTRPRRREVVVQIVGE